MEECVHINTDKVCFGYDISCSATEDYTLHCHNFYEVYFFLEGNVDYLVEGQKYIPAPGSLLLLSPHAFHGAKINDTQPYRRFSLHFHPDILSMERRTFLLSAFPVPEKQQRQNIYIEKADQYGLPVYFDALKNCAFLDPKLQEQMLPICIEALLARIISIQEPESHSLRGTDSGTVQDIIWFLNRHMREEINLDLVSERFFISKHHLNKIFRKATGTTVMNYLQYKRVIAAQQLLINGFSAQEAASESGFVDYSSFYRSYMRVLGHAPIRDRGTLPSLTPSMGEAMRAVSLKRQGE